MSRSCIAVAVDGSKPAGRAVAAAHGLSQATGRPLKFVYVHPEYEHHPGWQIPGQGELEEARQASARDVFARARAALPEKYAQPEEVLLWGDPAEELIAFMTGNPDTHLVLGRRGLSKFRTLILGSVTDKVVRHATGLVTVVD